MESDNKRLIAVGLLAFVGVAVLVAAVVFGFTTLITLVTGVDGPPQMLVVEVVGEEALQNASVVHLTDRDLPAPSVSWSRRRATHLLST